MIPGYKIYRLDRTRRGGGLVIYCNTQISSKIIENVNEGTEELEQLWIEVEFKKMNIAFGCVYIPHELPLYRMEIIEEMFGEIIPKYHHCICMGDFNLNLLSNSSTTQYFTNILQMFDLNQLITEPTRITDNTETLIDFVITDMTENVMESGTIDMLDMGCDHDLTYCLMNIKKEPIEPVIKTYRDYKNMDMENFYLDADRMNWNDIYMTQGIDDKLKLFNEKILQIYDENAPLKSIKIRSRKHLPWVTYNIKCLIREREKAKKNYLNKRTNESRAFYQNMRKEVKKAINREKAAYIKQKLNQHQNNNTNIWLEAKKLGVGKNVKNVELPHELNDPQVISDYFQSCVIKPEINQEIIAYYSNKNDIPTFNLHNVNSEYIKRALNRIKSKAVGIDGISVYMLQLLLPYCLLPLTHIINVSIEMGIIPNEWKTAIIQPIPKSDSVKEGKDLRPINILPIGSKILERIVYDQLYDHLNTHSLFPLRQAGFRKGFSTVTTLSSVVDDIITSKDKSMATVLVLIDMSKAFDSVDFDLLVAKLQSYGVRESSLSWFINYLRGRTVITRIQKQNVNVLSQPCIVESGVPQGSILGPLLFNIFTLDAPEVLGRCKLYMYADDFQVLISFSYEETKMAFDALNEEIDKLVNYITKNGLKVNASKSQLIAFGPKNFRSEIKSNYKLKIKDEPLEYSVSVKNLGLIMDENINFELHVQNKFKVAFLRLKTLYQYKNIVPKNVKILFVDSLILSLFNYCDCVYYPCLTEKMKKRIQRVQNAGTRYCLQLPRSEHTSRHIQDINWLRMDERQKMHLMCFVFKIITDKIPEFLYNKLKYRHEVHDRITRNRSKFDIPQHITTMFQSSFSYIAPKIANAIPGDCFNMNISQFRNYAKHEKLYLLV